MKDTIHVVPNTSGKPLRKVAHARDPQRNLDDIVGTWREDPAFDAALADQDTIDEKMIPPPEHSTSENGY